MDMKKVGSTLRFRDKNGRFRSIKERTLSQIWDYLFRYLDEPWNRFEYIPHSQYVDSGSGNIYASFKSKSTGEVGELPIADYYDYMNEINKGGKKNA